MGSGMRIGYGEAAGGRVAPVAPVQRGGSLSTVPGQSHQRQAPPHASAAPDLAEAQEQAILRAVRDGESGAWGRLVTHYQDRVYAVCLRMVGDRDAAADLAQDTFVKVIQGLGTYDGRSKLSTWITRVAMNACLSWKRSQKLRRHAPLDGPADGREGWEGARGRGLGTWGEGGEPGPHQSVELGERNDRIAAALAALPPEQRAILVLRDVQGLDYEQIAEVLGVAVGTVKSRLFRARMALRELIEGRTGGTGGGGGGGGRQTDA